MVGFSWLVGAHFEYGILRVYAGVFLLCIRALAVVAAGFEWGGWASRAADMMKSAAVWTECRSD